ncbi:MAG: ABC transporter substrate-binding protein [Treponema sp.]|jgi:ABC-type glycerol-3-phosphate transport system substrate-binding protein|nr:ABC transporter substrate-binding protein [Treponema sp.]
MKKFVFLIMILFSVNILSAQNANGNLTVWSFTDELHRMVDNYFNKAHPEIKIEYSQTYSDQFQRKLDPVLVLGRGAPDVFILESAFVHKYIESGYLLDITDIYEANKNKLLAYPVEVTTYNGKVYALTWQACPGAMFYRRSLAKKYLGTDDPVEVQEYFSDFIKFLETTELINEKSNGKCVTVSSRKDLFIPFLFARTQPWVVNKRVAVDPVMEQFMDLSKTLYDYRLEGRLVQWSEGWFAGMRDELNNTDSKDGLTEVFSYFLPTWGLHYVLKTNAPQTSGDWAMIQGPSPYYWGGSWLCAWKDTQNPNAAKEFIRYLATDNDFIEAWAKDTGDFVANTEVINKIRNNYAEPYLGNQKYYVAFSKIARSINGKLAQSTDEIIEEFFLEEVNNFIDGKKSKARALADFKSRAEKALGL